MYDIRWKLPKVKKIVEIALLTMEKGPDEITVSPFPFFYVPLVFWNHNAFMCVRLRMVLSDSLRLAVNLLSLVLQFLFKFLFSYCLFIFLLFDRHFFNLKMLTFTLISRILEIILITYYLRRHVCINSKSTSIAHWASYLSFDKYMYTQCPMPLWGSFKIYVDNVAVERIRF